MEKKQFNILIFVLSLLVVLQTCCLFVFGTKVVKAYEQGYSGNSPYFLSDNVILPSYDYYYHSTSLNFVFPISRIGGSSNITVNGVPLTFEDDNFLYFTVNDSFGTNSLYNGSITSLKTFLTYPSDSDFLYTPFTSVGIFSFNSGDTVLYCSVEGYDGLLDSNYQGLDSYDFYDYIGFEFGVADSDSKFDSFLYDGNLVPGFPSVSAPFYDDGYYYYYSYYFGWLDGLIDDPYLDIEVDLVVSIFVPISEDLVTYYPSYASYFDIDSYVFEELFDQVADTYYDIGFEAGFIEGGDEANYNPFSSLVMGVNSLLNTEIFPGFRLGYLFYIAIGVLLFTLLIKVFLN